MATDFSERTLRDPKHARGQRDVETLAAHRIGKKELCRQENVFWNLLHDMDIESIKLRK